MIDVILNDYDSRLIEMYLALYNTCTIACYGKEWVVNTTEDTIEFKGYKGFIDFIEEELKCGLLNYAFYRELDELVDVDVFKNWK